MGPLSILEPGLVRRDAGRGGGGKGERADRLALALDRIARRRGTVAEFAATAVQFLQALGVWCVEIELAGQRVRFDMLPGEMQRRLAPLAPGAASRCEI